MSKNAEKHILIVDDDEDDRNFFCSTLNQVNPEVECLSASNGKEALEFLDKSIKQKPSVIFLDINMPVMTGWEFLTRIKKMEKVRNIPVIMFSTSSNQRDIDIAYELGAFSYFIKPEEPETLKSMLKFINENLNKLSQSLLRSAAPYFQFPKN